MSLKALRQDFAHVLSVLETKTAASPTGTAHLADTQSRLRRWIAEVDDICSPEMQEICGPSMDFPRP